MLNFIKNFFTRKKPSVKKPKKKIPKKQTKKYDIEINNKKREVSIDHEKITFALLSSKDDNELDSFWRILTKASKKPHKALLLFSIGPPSENQPSTVTVTPTQDKIKDLNIKSDIRIYLRSLGFSISLNK